MIKLLDQLLKRIPQQEKRISLPTMLTLLRIALTPFVVFAMMRHQWDYALILFIIAASTDILDGMIARLLNAQTVVGACLDPVADKILVLSSFITLGLVASPVFLIPSWFIFLVLCKEVIIVGGSILLYLRQGYITIAPTILGKLTTALQVSFIVWVFSCHMFHWVPRKTFIFVLCILFMFIIVSCIQYVSIGFRFWQKRTMEK